jgi:hypothetical protein
VAVTVAPSSFLLRAVSIGISGYISYVCTDLLDFTRLEQVQMLLCVLEVPKVWVSAISNPVCEISSMVSPSALSFGINGDMSDSGVDTASVLCSPE